MFGILKTWLLAVLTGNRINEGFLFFKKMYGLFAGPKNSGRNNELTVLPRWPYKTGYHCSTQDFLGAAYMNAYQKGLR